MEPNLTKFDDFLRSLRKTNASLGYFTDFDKCGENLKAVSIKLHTLDFLLGSKDLKTDIFTLFGQNKECFDALNLSYAARIVLIFFIDVSQNSVMSLFFVARFSLFICVLSNDNS